jgi:hypothetical protein
MPERSADGARTRSEAEHRLSVWTFVASAVAERAAMLSRSAGWTIGAGRTAAPAPWSAAIARPARRAAARCAVTIARATRWTAAIAATARRVGPIPRWARWTTATARRAACATTIVAAWTAITVAARCVAPRA